MSKLTNLSFISLILLFPVACSDDDKDPPEITYTATISTMSTAASESDPGTGFNIQLDQSYSGSGSLTVTYELTGTATGGSDYQAPNGSASIASGADNVVVEIPFIDDNEVENEETIIITLLESDNVALGNTFTLTITISDNDSNDPGTCPNDNSIDQSNHQCDKAPDVSNSYSESISGDTRTIVTNGIPTHDYRNQIPDLVQSLNSQTRTYRVDLTPEIATSLTSILDQNFMPAYSMGVARNGVPIDPAPGMPFIFENTQTGEYNWDWVMEPNNNMDAVGLDCAIAHVQPDGTYHYHGDMAVYADQLLDGLGTGSTIPTDPVLIGWGADGFPILYKYGPDATGSLKELTPGYRLKSGDRPGDGVSEPCGEYNGKYTNDFEFVEDLGDLDACNGFEGSVTINGETFGYFYVITEDFPVIPRCITGTPDNSFKKGM